MNISHYPDARTNTVGAAAAFSEAAGLTGVVTACAPLLEPYGPRLVAQLSRRGTRPLCSYGGANNDPASAALQLDMGLSAVILDHVNFVSRALAATTS